MGFKPAASIKKTDRVLRYRFDIGQSIVPQFDNQHTPATAEKVFETLAARRGTASAHVSRDDLHGDARFTDGKIDIVIADSRLLMDPNAKTTHGVGDLILKIPDMRLSPLSRLCASMLPFGGVDPASPSAMRRFDLSDNALRVGLHELPLDPFCVGPASNIDASFYKSADYGGATDPNFSAQLLHGHPDVIAVDDVVDVRELDFSGHVYDTVSEGGWIIAQGLAISNCRCTVVVRIEELDSAIPQFTPGAGRSIFPNR
jgi:hypothetical protein